MTIIEFEDGAIQVDATIIGEGLGIEPSLIQGTVVAASVVLTVAAWVTSFFMAG